MPPPDHSNFRVLDSFLSFSCIGVANYRLLSSLSLSFGWIFLLIGPGAGELAFVRNEPRISRLFEILYLSFLFLFLSFLFVFVSVFFAAREAL
jgi:hypothetical protein